MNHQLEYRLDTHLRSSYMILQTRAFNRKIVSIGVLNSRFFLIILLYFLRTPLHELAFYRLNYPLCLFPHNSTMRLYISTYYLFYVSFTSFRIYKLNLLYKRATEHTLHSTVFLSITQNVDCCFSKNYRIMHTPHECANPL